MPADPEIAQVEAALERVLHSRPFLHSRQLQRMLRFLVAEKLAGRGDNLKEYAIGVDVFDRPSSYDPRLDSIVRVEARRLRSALGQYYSGEGQGDAVIIELTKGRRILKDAGLEFERGGLSDLKRSYIYLALGERERVFEHLQRDFEQRDPELPYINVDPVFDPVRDDPRFIAIVRKLGLPTGAAPR